MNKSTNQPSLVLASSSPYRRELLARLCIPFTCESPDIDETALNHESVEDLVIRLATAKATKIARKYPLSIVIGSDQVAVLHDEILGKPGEYQTALLQLQKCSGQSVIFYTGLCVLNAERNTVQTGSIPFTVKFRKLDTREMKNYLTKEQPYNCAGSFKSEGLGVTLLESMKGDDPSALIGLPLIRLCEMLRQENVALP